MKESKEIWIFLLFIMDHIEMFHVRPFSPIGSSYFYFKRNEVYTLIKVTINNPNAVEPHQSDYHNPVKKKTFKYDIGYHSRIGAPCNKIFVVYKTNSCFQDYSIYHSVGWDVCNEKKRKRRLKKAKLALVSSPRGK